MTEKEPENMVLDYMGIPLKRAEVIAMRDRANRHLKLSPRKLAEYANKVMQEKHPTMALQVIYTEDDFK